MVDGVTDDDSSIRVTEHRGGGRGEGHRSLSSVIIHLGSYDSYHHLVVLISSVSISVSFVRGQDIQ